jgi:hypothetical protein
MLALWAHVHEGNQQKVLLVKFLGILGICAFGRNWSKVRDISRSTLEAELAVFPHRWVRCTIAVAGGGLVRMGALVTRHWLDAPEVADSRYNEGGLGLEWDEAIPNWRRLRKHCLGLGGLCTLGDGGVVIVIFRFYWLGLFFRSLAAGSVRSGNDRDGVISSLLPLRSTLFGRR